MVRFAWDYSVTVQLGSALGKRKRVGEDESSLQSSSEAVRRSNCYTTCGEEGIGESEIGYASHEDFPLEPPSARQNQRYALPRRPPYDSTVAVNTQHNVSSAAPSSRANAGIPLVPMVTGRGDSGVACGGVNASVSSSPRQGPQDNITRNVRPSAPSKELPETSDIYAQATQTTESMKRLSSLRRWILFPKVRVRVGRQKTYTMFCSLIVNKLLVA